MWKEAYALLSYLTLARFGAEGMPYALVYVTFSFVHLLTQREQDHNERLELQANLPVLSSMPCRLNSSRTFSSIHSMYSHC